MDRARRQFLRGGGRTLKVRPPWLISPGSFTSDCTRCGNCIALCPQHIISAGDGGFPEVDFRLGECTFCEACTRRCEAQLFDAAGGEHTAWNNLAVVSERCLTLLGVMCRSCEDACESQAIRFPLTVGAVPKPEVNALQCNGCGACVQPCPENAIALLARSEN